MRKRSSSNGSRSSSSTRRSGLRFDEFGFALTKRKDQKLHHRCHDYSYPQMSSVRVKELCELLSYWNGASFICKSQIERFIRMGIPPNLRGRVWTCLLNIDSLRETSDFNYQKCLSEVRGPLVDLGVSEYGILSAIATLSETQNHLGLNQHPLCPEHTSSVGDITLFRQIALDLQRSFPSHRSLQGESPEAIEGQAKLFRVLIAYAKYSPQVGYSQGMSYIAAVLLMQLGEEEAFWALAALLDKPKYLAELFDLSLTRIQHQVKMFDQFLKHRKPQLFQHMESVGVLSVHFVMPWFLTLFTSLPCWDSVLAVWDLIILHGLSAVFRTALTIIELLEPRLMELTDEGALLPLLLRVPVDVSQYTVLVPALWNTDVQDWELKCMNSLVLDESHHGPKAEQCEMQKASLPTQVHGGEDKENVSTPTEGQKTTGKEQCEMQKASLPTQVHGGEDKENVSTPTEGQKTTGKESVTKAKGALTRLMHLAQRYLLDPMGRQRVAEKGSKTQAKPRQRSPASARVSKSRTSASLTEAQMKSRRRSQSKSGAQQPIVVQQGSGDDVIMAPVTGTDTAGFGQTDRSQKAFRRSGTSPVVKCSRRRSNHSLAQPIKAKSLRLIRSGKKPLGQAAPSSSTCPPSTSLQPSSPPLSSAPQGREQPEQQDTPRTALIKELSSRYQTRVPFRDTRESKLI